MESNVISEINVQLEKLNDNLRSKLSRTYISENSGLDFYRQYEEDDNSGEGSSSSRTCGEACRDLMNTSTSSHIHVSTNTVVTVCANSLKHPSQINRYSHRVVTVKLS
jgi:hypothetical protein